MTQRHPFKARRRFALAAALALAAAACSDTGPAGNAPAAKHTTDPVPHSHAGGTNDDFLADPESKSLWKRATEIESRTEDEREQLFKDTIAYLKEHGATKGRVDLAMIVAQLVYRDQEAGFAGAYEQIAGIMAKSDNEGMQADAVRLEGVVRRLQLIGKPVEIDGTTLDEAEFSWDRYQGKVVLIDFWATWCGYCIEELPNVKANYKRFHDRGFEVVGITFDSDPDLVEKFIQNHSIPWTNLFSVNGPQQPVAVRYGVSSIPTTFLVDRDGTVVSTSIRGPELGRKLEELLGSPGDEAATDQPAETADPNGSAKINTSTGPLTTSTINDDDASKSVVNSVGMKLARITAGEFLMGSPVSDSHAHDDEQPQHTVSITRPFYLGVHEVTQHEYEQVMGANPSRFAQSGSGKDVVEGEDTKRLPVEYVSWLDAVTFCNRLSDREKRSSCYRIEGEKVTLAAGDGYRLPTEAEWMYACRAGSKTSWHFGDDPSELDKYAWFNKNAQRRTHAVGQKRPNAFGLYDMYGNTWEWCQDWYGKDYYGGPAADDPTGPAAGTHRVICGGSWFNDSSGCRSSVREHIHPGSSYNTGGFRVLRVR